MTGFLQSAGESSNVVLSSPNPQRKDLLQGKRSEAIGTELYSFFVDLSIGRTDFPFFLSLSSFVKLVIAL